MMSSGRNGIARALSDFVLHRNWPPGHGYAFATSAVLIAFLLRYFLMGVLDDRAIYILFVPPILLAAMTGGAGPGMLAVVLSICSAV
jgi:two-component system sensor kinase FixL